MKKVIIIPTEETSWGIADRYDIKSDRNNVVLHEDVPQESLIGIVKDNNYKVIGGEKYL